MIVTVFLDVSRTCRSAGPRAKVRYLIPLPQLDTCTRVPGYSCQHRIGLSTTSKRPKPLRKSSFRPPCVVPGPYRYPPGTRGTRVLHTGTREVPGCKYPGTRGSIGQCQTYPGTVIPVSPP
eukprot:970174-Rhodomonas_salina.2